MSFDIQALAKQKSLQNSQNEGEWIKALQNAQVSLSNSVIDFSSLKEIALASQSPSKFSVMTRLIYHYSKSHPHSNQFSKVLFEYVNNSPFSLSDWIDATDYFYSWLKSNKRKIDFLPMLEYLECCVASPDSKESGQSLTELVESMLKNFDYEAG